MVALEPAGRALQRRRGLARRLPIIGEHVLRLDMVAAADLGVDRRGLDPVGELPDIARPLGGLDRTDRARAERLAGQLMALDDLAQELEAERYEILGALGERRDVDLEHLQAV